MLRANAIHFAGLLDEQEAYEGILESSLSSAREKAKSITHSTTRCAKMEEKPRDDAKTYDDDDLEVEE